MTLSNPYTTPMLEADLINPQNYLLPLSETLPPFTNTFIPGYNYAYYVLPASESYIQAASLQYKFKVSPAPAFTLQWDDEFIPQDGSTPTDTIQNWTSTIGTETETPVTQITGTMLEAGPSGWHFIYPILIERDNQPINGNNNNVAVGQQINLTLYAPGLEGNITNYQWTIPGNAFKDYQPTDSHGNAVSNPLKPLAPTDLNSPTASSISFYWSDATDNRQILCTITLNGRPYTFTVTLNVKRPVGSITTTVGSRIAADGNYPDAQPPSLFPIWLHFGAEVKGNVGMNFSEMITLPPDMPRGVTGNFCWAQVVSGIIIQDTYSDTGSTITTTSSGIDTHFPYNNEENQPTTDDSPAMPLTIGNHQSNGYEDFGATMYLMWQPILPPGSSDALHDSTVWVPLRGVYWHWNGTAVSSDGNNWTLQSSNLPTNLSDFPVMTEPQWTKNVTDP
jgi:hypothetical protein